MEAGMVLCVRASSQRNWIPVPTVKRGRETSVTICGGQRWLHQVLVGGGTDRDALDASLAIKAFEQHVRAHVGSLQPACSQKKTDSATRADISRKRRLLQDSDEEGDGAKPSTGGSDSASSPDSQRKQRQRGLTVAGFLKVPLGAVSYTHLTLPTICSV